MLNQVKMEFKVLNIFLVHHKKDLMSLTDPLGVADLFWRWLGLG